jgi:hypothetical protein
MDGGGGGDIDRECGVVKARKSFFDFFLFYY